MKMEVRTCEWCCQIFYQDNTRGRPAKFCCKEHNNLMGRLRRAQREIEAARPSMSDLFTDGHEDLTPEPDTMPKKRKKKSA